MPQTQRNYEGGYMAWARLDDGWHEHPKTIEAGLEAAGLWAMCLTWAHKHRQQTAVPGAVPVSVVDRLGGRKGRALARKLVQVGFFDELTDAGWPIHDFAMYLPKYDPAKAAENGRKGGQAKRNGSKPLGEPPPEPPGSSHHEPPTEPVSEHQNGSVGKPEATRADTGASARRNPVPVPITTSEPSVPREDRTSPGAEVIPIGAVTAQTLIGEWIDHCARRPPARVIGQTSAELAALVAEGFPPDVLRRGLADWHRRGQHPSTLPSFVNAAANAGGSLLAARSTTDDRVAAGLAMVEKYRALEANGGLS